MTEIMSIPDPTEQFERVDRHVKDNEKTHVVMLATHYTNPIAEVWDSITQPQRLADWFGTVTGDLRTGGSFAVEDRGVTGTIQYCDRHRAIQLEWTENERTGKVAVAVTTGVTGTSVTVRHTVADDQRWGQYGPAELGVEWDEALAALDVHLSGNIGHTREVLEQIHAEQGQDALRGRLVEAWRQEHVTAGAAEDDARQRSEAAARLLG